MDLFLKYILPILISGFIGWFTNYLAIIMLFRPYNKLTLFGIGLPFTPGLIPKEKTRIADSLAHTISNDLLNKDVLCKYLTNDELKSKILEITDDVFNSLKENEETFYSMILRYVNKEDVEKYFTIIKEKISDELIKKFNEHDLSKKISSKIIKSFINENDSVLGKTLNFILNDKLTSNIESIVQDKIDEYINKNGKKEIENVLDKEMLSLLSNSTSSLCMKYENVIIIIKKHLINVYEILINNSIERILNVINLKQIIYERICELDVKELEKLILNIAKKELNAITYIGGILGLLIGTINIFI